jgi:hypothetical protein
MESTTPSWVGAIFNKMRSDNHDACFTQIYKEFETKRLTNGAHGLKQQRG